MEIVKQPVAQFVHLLPLISSFLAQMIYATGCGIIILPLLLPSFRGIAFFP